MGFLENLTNDAFANKMADHYQTHIGAAPFKSIRAESGDNPQTPAWGAQPYLERGMRGGISQLTAPAFDSIRIGGFMASPKGLLFIAKQVGLQRSNPKGEFLTPGGVPIPVHSSRRYNAASTLAQVLLGPLGIHIDRHDKGSENSEDLHYEKRIKKLNVDSPTSNRLVSIASQLKVGYHRKLDLISSEVFTLNYVESLEQKKTTRNSNSNKARFEGPIIINAMSGIGGPNSFFGLGDTFHKAYVRNLPKFTATYYKPPSKALPVGDPGPDSYTGIKGIEGDYGAISDTDNFSPIKIPANGSSGAHQLAKYQALNYGGIVKASKNVSTATPLKSFSSAGGEGNRYGNRHNSYSRIGLIDYGKGDRYGDSYGETDSAEDEGSDFVTLKLKRGSDILKFRSYGLGSITDNTSFDWSEVKYVGRTMAQQKFNSVSRDVSHDLTIVAFSALELEMNYTKLNELYQMASPSVDATTGLATAPFCKLTLGDLYVNQNVIIDKITFTVDEATSWDINYGEPQVETAGAELPMVVKLNLGYKLITNADGGFFSKSSNYWNPQF